MGHLDELQAKYSDKGLTVIALTNEGRGLVDRFVADTGARHPIVIESGDSLRAYGGTGFPTMVVIGADGRIAANGMPNEAMIEDLLKKVRLAPKLPAKLAPAQQLLDRKKYGEARKLLEKSAAEGAPEDERSAATAAIEWIDATGKATVEDARADLERPDAR